MLRSLLLRASRSPFLKNQAQKRRFARRAAARFLPGETVDDALTAARRLRRRGMPTVLTQLGESLTDAVRLRAVAAHYERALARIAESKLDAHLSIKPTHVGLELREEVARQNLARIADAARAARVVLWLDMEESRHVDATLRLARGAREHHGDVGVCLQAYLRRTPADIAALEGSGLRVRLVKGAYREAEAVAYRGRKEIVQAYLRCAEQLMRDRDRVAHAPPAFGTHDDRLIDHLGRLARTLGVGSDQYEVQMLYGIRVPLQDQLTAAGTRVRVLISYGADWYPWFVRRLAEKPTNLFLLARSVFGG